jgi:selenocysteine lyase/cysteine desulfurase
LSEGSSRREKLQNTFSEIHTRKMDLFKQLWDGLSAINGVRLYGQPPVGKRTPTLAFTYKNIDSEVVSKKLVERGVFTSHGDFYAQTVVERLGVEKQGLVRVGCACYTTQEEIERVIEGVKEIAR